MDWVSVLALRWRQNRRDSVSNHQPHDCLLNGLFRRRSTKTSKLLVTGLRAGNSPGTSEFPAQMTSYAENVSIWWRHHGRYRVDTILSTDGRIDNVKPVFLHDRPWISQRIKSISNELDITIHVIASQLFGHCDVISNRLWRHQQTENWASGHRPQDHITMYSQGWWSCYQ